MRTEDKALILYVILWVIFATIMAFIVDWA